MGEQRYFEYDEQAIAYLKARDERLAEAIDAIGPVRREVTPDLFAALVNCIVGQQISTKAQVTIWKRLTGAFGDITPEAMAACPDDELQQFGLSFRKVGYIKGAAERVVAGELDLKGLADLPDEEVCRRLSALPGIGVWTAEMLMTFSMQRPDIMSYGDLAILRGLRMLHHHRRIARAVREVPPPLLAVRLRGEPLPVGDRRRRRSGLRDWAPKGGGAKRPRPGGAKGGSRGD
ncbi:MAG: DNA-3-methyladenine glycosylase 2 family protein [Gordonibacter pamelaeae]